MSEELKYTRLAAFNTLADARAVPSEDKERTLKESGHRDRSLNDLQALRQRVIAKRIAIDALKTEGTDEEMHKQVLTEQAKKNLWVLNELIAEKSR